MTHNSNLLGGTPPGQQQMLKLAKAIRGCVIYIILIA
jgi:hypothetical protein